ncbi:hypothetical protein ACFO8O_08240 [Hephaestia sp. GCM10023244]|uniref:hypothetical protein n=1 Tax=unclassified Hephaestia TaxID=2631281 RepID=UPI00207755C1|nr:hypothetical protein [Hephaestia sp. MAHUQ-44]MCM8730947.1 hypothetical protein [Hephaestia sp. MAHUQ-44]
MATGLVGLALAGGPARAQDQAQTPQTPPAETTLPNTIPGLENFSLPPSNDRLRAPQNTPRTAPTPRASTAPTATPPPAPTPRASPLMIQPLPTPSAAPLPQRTPAPRATAAPMQAPTATPPPEPQAEATPAPIPVAAPSPVASPVPTPIATATPLADTPDGPNGRSLLPLVLVLLAIVVVGLAWLWLARRRAGPDAEDAAADTAAEPIAPLPSRAAQRPRLDLGFRPRRAGMNVLSAAVDYELVVRNQGDAAARDVRIALQLFTAGDHHDAELRDYLDDPVEAPIVAAFDLAAGETRTVRAIALLPKEAVNVVTVQGRPMFVPLVAINALYHWGTDQHGQTATSHVVGIAQPGSAKMQPFWLDAPARMYDRVGEHAHAIALTR